MKKVFVSFTCLFALVLCSCRSSKETALNDFKEFQTELSTNGDTYSIKDWKKAAEKYEKINSNLLKYEYNNSEMEEIGRLHGQCAKSFTSALTSKVSGIGSFLKGLYDSFKDSIDFDFDLNKLFQGMGE